MNNTNGNENNKNYKSNTKSQLKMEFPTREEFDLMSERSKQLFLSALFDICKKASVPMKTIKEDVALIMERDPAAKSPAEVLLLYPGLHALIAYRAAHALYKKGHFFSARMLSQAARHATGIEIHPGAKIGKGLFIDHGAGVVIGETAEIGDYCTLYQGVTLGGTGKDTGKRHPTLGNNVMIGAGAKILGPFKIGDNAKIAAGAVVLAEVPCDCTAVGIPAKIIKCGNKKVEATDLDQVHIPDPVAQELTRLGNRIAELEQHIEKGKDNISE